MGAQVLLYIWTFSVLALFVAGQLTLSISPTNATPTEPPSNDLSLSQNIRVLTESISRSPSPYYNRASLVGIYLYGSPHFTTTDPHALRDLTVYFHPYRAPLPLNPREREVFVVRNDPLRWGHWLPPSRTLINKNVYDWQREIQWEGMQALMTLEDADRRLKAAGHGERYGEISIDWLRGENLGYCFTFAPAVGKRGVRVEVLTKEVVEVPVC
ncbi:MAG: hypothetical protein Q9222_003391 [Ikaeria aurantiellina]